MSWNRYAYVLNSPLGWVDPDGRAEAEAGAMVLERQATRAGGKWALRVFGRAAPPVAVALTAQEGWDAGRAIGESELVPGDSIDEFYTDMFYEALFSDSDSEFCSASDNSTFETTTTKQSADNNAMARSGKRRPNLDENKAGRKKQGREGRQKARKGKNWKPHNNKKPQEPPKHTSSKKD